MIWLTIYLALMQLRFVLVAMRCGTLMVRFLAGLNGCSSVAVVAFLFFIIIITEWFLIAPLKANYKLRLVCH